MLIFMFSFNSILADSVDEVDEDSSEASEVIPDSPVPGRMPAGSRCLLALGPVSNFIPSVNYRMNHETDENTLLLNWHICAPLVRTSYSDFKQNDEVKNMHVLATFIEAQAISDDFNFNYCQNNFLWGFRYLYSHEKIHPIMFMTELAVTMTEEFDFGPTIGAGITFNYTVVNLSAMVRETWINNERITDFGLDFFFTLFVDFGCCTYLAKTK